jgi:pyruvate,orthophosphate dikinase
MIFTYDATTPSAPAMVAHYRALHRLGLQLPPGVFVTENDSLGAAVEAIEHETGKKFGDTLFLSLRGGYGPKSHVEIPYIGMAPPKTREQARAYRQLLGGFLRVTLNSPEESLDELFDTSPGASDDKEAIASARQRYQRVTGHAFPDEPLQQLARAAGAMLPHGPVLLQMQLTTDEGARSGVGATSTRDPATGERRLTGDYLAQGVAAELPTHRRSPVPLSRHQRGRADESALEAIEPHIYGELQRIAHTLESHFKDAQYFSFAVAEGSLYVLDTQPSKRSARAAVRIVVDLVRENIIDKREALLRTSPESLEQLIHPNIAPKAKRKVIAKGLPASPGAGSGAVVFSADEAQSMARTGRKVILVRVDTSPEDIHGVSVAQGVLTSRGGMTSHAAVVARGMGKCCVVGCTELRVDYQAKQFSTDEVTVKEGDIITLDGSTGEVIFGEVETLVPELGEDFGELLGWADEVRKLGVRANANTLQDAEVAARFGAEGIGLCRTEQLLLQGDRLRLWREVLIAANVSERKRALTQLEPLHAEDIFNIFSRIAPHPVTVRLLDPPLAEFLPENEAELLDLARVHGLLGRAIEQRKESLHEVNPMLGHRGCRLAVTHPEIYEMQVRAIITAACRVAAQGRTLRPEIMFPMASSARELDFVRSLTDRVAQQTMSELGQTITYRLGTMIEVPRAAWMAKDLARLVDFFSFGTNDLTQTMFGISRDDAGKFLSAYIEQGLLPADPFVTIDRDCVGEIISRACRDGRESKPELELGLCGEHGGDPASIAFCHEIGIGYVSCSPYRVPLAKLAAAHAALKGKN